MRLAELHKLPIDVELNQIIEELRVEYSVLVESNRLDEGFNDFIKKGAAKVSALVGKTKQKGQQAYDAIMGRVLVAMNKDMPEVAKRLKVFAGNHKMATVIIAVVGASLLAMDPASAGQAMDVISQQDVNSIADTVSQTAQVVDQVQVSPKLLQTLADKMDGRFSGLNGPISGQDAIKIAAKAHGTSVETAINQLMQSSGDKQEFLTNFKSWVGSGVKTAAGFASK